MCKDDEFNHLCISAIIVYQLHFSDGTESVRLTHEQMRIVKYQPKSDEIIKIVAFAGMNFLQAG